MEDEPLTPRLQADIERWFVQRGVPQLVEGYTTEQRMDARAAPFIVGWLVLGTTFLWGTRPDRAVAWNGVGVIAMLLFLALTFTVARRLRGLRPWPASPTVDPLDVGLMGALVAVAAGIVASDPGGGVTAGLNALLGMGAIYAIIGFGLVEIGIWGFRRLIDEVLNIFGLLARTLPVLLILVLFLVFSSELWEAAHELSVAELGAVLALMLAVAVLLVVTALGAEMAMLRNDDFDTVRLRARSTPAEPLARAATSGVPPAPPLTWLQRLNVTLLVVFSQLIQSVFVGILVTSFLVVLGLLALPASLQERWVSGEIGAMARFDFLGEMRTLSHELVSVSTLLGGVVGLYFTGLAVTDPTHRAEHFSRVIDEVRQLLAVRTLYGAALQRKPSTE